MGVSAKVAKWGDVYGTDEEMLAWVPQPVLAVVLLFPVTKNNLEFRKKQFERIQRDGQKVSDKIFYLTQLDGSSRETKPRDDAPARDVHPIATNNSLRSKQGWETHAER